MLQISTELIHILHFCHVFCTSFQQHFPQIRSIFLFIEYQVTPLGAIKFRGYKEWQ